MRVVLLSNASSIHTIQWANHLAKLGLDVQIISQHPAALGIPQHIPVNILPFKGFVGYFLNAFILRKILKKINPDLLNVHYASGYGTTARLANFHPYVLSVWGSDVFEFPYRSFFHKWLLKKNLESADVIASTSICMALQTKLYTSHKNIEITPFGVDLNKFNSIKYPKSNTNTITLGTVKTLKHVYGIDVLIRAFAILYREFQVEDVELGSKLQFRIVGGGPDVDNLKLLASDLGILHLIEFVGSVTHSQVPEELSKLDIYVALSRQESFGVAVIEAQAMSVPVVVSNVGGLPEVVENGQTGFIVESENPQQAADMMKKLILDMELRNSMSVEARQFVHSHFSWPSCAKKMSQVYQNTLNIFKAR